MSKALKCDRCQTCFDPSEVPEGLSFTSIGEIYLQSSKEYAENKYRLRMHGINLCPKCTDMFLSFMTNEDLIKIQDDEKERISDAAFKSGYCFGTQCLTHYQLLESCRCCRSGERQCESNKDDGSDKTPKRPSRTKKTGDD